MTWRERRADVDRRVRNLRAEDPRGVAVGVMRELVALARRYLRSVFHREHEVTEALAQWAENMLRGLAWLEGRSSPSIWALRVAWHVVLDRTPPWGLSLATSTLDPGETIYVGSKEGERRLALLEVRRALTAEQLTLLFLRIDQEISWGQIAEIMSTPGTRLSARTVSQRYHALEDLVVKLARGKGLLLRPPA